MYIQYGIKIVQSMMEWTDSLYTTRGTKLSLDASDDGNRLLVLTEKAQHTDYALSVPNSIPARACTRHRKGRGKKGSKVHGKKKGSSFWTSLLDSECDIRTRSSTDLDVLSPFDTDPEGPLCQNDVIQARQVESENLRRAPPVGPVIPRYRRDPAPISCSLLRVHNIVLVGPILSPTDMNIGI